MPMDKPSDVLNLNIMVSYAVKIVLIRTYQQEYIVINHLLPLWHAHTHYEHKYANTHMVKSNVIQGRVRQS